MNINLSNIRFNCALPFRSNNDKNSAVSSSLEKYSTELPVYGSDVIRTNPAQLSLFHMHDFHGQNIRMERAYSAIRQFDNDLLQNQNDIFNDDLPVDKLKLCSGDMFLGANLKETAAVNEFLNIAGVLANAIGNHECDMNMNDFTNIVKNKNYRFIGVNMHPDKDNKISSIKSNSFIAEVHGNKYGIIGLAPLDMRDHVKLQDDIDKFNIQDLDGTVVDIERDIKALKDRGVNKIILISHLGLTNDQYLAKNVSDIDIILGGHSHDLLKQVKEGENLIYSPKDEPVLIMQVGRDGEYISVPNIKFNELGQITEIQYNTLHTDAFSRDYVAKNDFETILGKPEVVGRVRKVDSLPQNIYIEENPHADFIADCIKSEFNADIALINSANIRSFFDKGDVDTRQLRLITPFANKMAVIKVSEKEIVDTLNRLIKTSMESFDNRPGIMQVSGIEYVYSKSLKRMTELYFIDKNNNRIEIDLENPRNDKFYTVVADDFCIKNDYAGLNLKDRLDNPITITDSDKDTFVADYMRKHKEPFYIKSDGRIKVIE